MLALVAVGITACGSRAVSSRGATETQAGGEPSVAELTSNGGEYAPEADSLFAFVEKQTALGPRNPGSEGHRQAVDLLTSELKRLGADTVEVQRAEVTSPFGGPYTAQNILGRFNPKAQKRLLLLAHYDTRPVADQEEGPAASRPISGANDGASGVAVLLETARLLGQSPLPEEGLGVDLLMVDVEDSGTPASAGADDEDSWCLGTQEWVKAMPYTAENRPAFALLFDMVGGQEARFHREQLSDLMARNINDRVWATAAKLGLSQRFPNEPGGAVVDDHLHINRAGIPCVDIIESRSAQTGSFPPTWHTHGDNLQAIDRNALRDACRVGMAVILQERP